MAKVKKAINNFLNLIANGDPANLQGYDTELRKKREELQGLQQKLDSIKTARQSMRSVEDMIRLAKKQLSNPDLLLTDPAYGDHEQNELKKKIVRQFVAKAEIDSSRGAVDIYFYRTPQLDPELDQIKPESLDGLSASRTRRRTGMGGDV